VTSQAPRAGTQLTGAAARSRASAGCGSASRAASVTRAAGVFGAGTLEHYGLGQSGRAGHRKASAEVEKIAETVSVPPSPFGIKLF